MVTVSVKAIEYDSKPYGFFIFAMDYLKAGDASAGVDFDKRINYPAYFLYARALELVMKSILLQDKRYSITDLRNKNVFGHDLSQGLKLIKSEGLEHLLVRYSPSIDQTVGDLNEWYRADRKKFEYYGVITGIESFRKQAIKEGAYPALPDLHQLRNLLGKFINPRVEKYVLK